MCVIYFFQIKHFAFLRKFVESESFHARNGLKDRMGTENLQISTVYKDHPSDYFSYLQITSIGQALQRGSRVHRAGMTVYTNSHLMPFLERPPSNDFVLRDHQMAHLFHPPDHAFLNDPFSNTEDPLKRIALGSCHQIPNPEAPLPRLSTQVDKRVPS